VEAEEAADRALLAKYPNIIKAEFRRRLRINGARSNALYVKLHLEHVQLKAPATDPTVTGDVAL
jgi:hypothetical protein